MANLPVPNRSTGISSVFADPFRSFETRWDQLMNRFMEEQPDSGLASYPVDIDEDEKHVYVEAELPGFSRDEINVSLETGTLTISAERKEESRPEGRTRHLSERRYSRVQRSFSLPESVDEENVDAKLEGGVLHIVLNKRPETQRRQIEVK